MFADCHVQVLSLLPADRPGDPNGGLPGMTQPRAQRPASLLLWNCPGRKQTWCSGCQREGSAAEWTWPASCWKDKHEPRGEREEGKMLRNPAAEPCATLKIYNFSLSHRLQMAGDFRAGGTLNVTPLFPAAPLEVFLSPSSLLPLPPEIFFSSPQAKSSSSNVFVCLGFLKITASGREMVCLARNNDRLLHNECLQRRGMNSISA